jgi:plasmid stabilization system protein ParE
VDYRLLYSQRSLNDLGEILGHIAEEDAEAASRFGASLLDHVDLLSRFPRLGGVIRKRSRVRKLLHSPLLVYYRLDEDKRLIEIVHVRHGARKQPSNAELQGNGVRNHSVPCGTATRRTSAVSHTLS